MNNLEVKLESHFKRKYDASCSSSHLELLRLLQGVICKLIVFQSM